MFENLIHQGALAQRGTAIRVNGQDYTYSAMASAIDRAAAWLAMQGIARRQVALVHTHDASLYWLLFFALERLGAISAAVPSSVKLDETLLKQAGCDWVLSFTRSPSNDDRWITIDDVTLRAMSQIGSAAPTPRRSAADPVSIVLSSGTTGEPKPVLLTREILDLRTINAIEAGFSVPQTRMSCFMPFYSIGGILAALQAWRVGGSIVFPHNERLEMSLADRNCDSVVVVPVHCQQILEHLPDLFRRETKLTIFCGGATLSDAVRQALIKRLNASVIEGYGTTETGIVTKLDVQANADKLQTSGKVLPWFEVAITDDDGGSLPAGEIGHVRIRGAEVVMGYWGETRPEHPTIEEGWYQPGDLGSIDEDGFLTISGRRDDLMNCGGRKALPATIEEAIRCTAGISDVAVFSAPDAQGTADRMWIAVVGAHENLAASVGRSLAIFPALSLVRLDEIPRNAMGKIARDQLRQQALAGQFADREERVR